MHDNLKDKEPKDWLFGKMIVTGFVGGIIWTVLFVFIYVFHFSEVAPITYIVEPWLEADWVSKWQGHLLSIGLAGVLSLIPSIIYYYLLKRLNFMWIGVLYGMILWVLFFVGITPIFVSNTVRTFSLETIISTISLFILYGTFIGYTISYNYYTSNRKAKQKVS